MAGLGLNEDLEGEEQSPLPLEQALAKQTDPAKLVAGLESYHKAVDEGRMPFTSQVGEMVKARLTELASGAKSVGSAVSDAFDPGPAPTEMGLEGSYRDPLNTATGSRMNPLTAAGFALLSTGEGMQGKPLSILEMQKHGIAREGNLQEQRAKQMSLRLAAHKQQVEENLVHVKNYEGILTKLEDLEAAGSPVGSEEYMTLYNKGKKDYMAQGGTAQEWATTFSAAKQSTAAQREVLAVVQASPLVGLLPPSAVKEAVAGIMKSPKDFETAGLYTALTLNEVARANKQPPPFSDAWILDRQAQRVGKTGPEVEKDLAEARSARAKAAVDEESITPDAQVRLQAALKSANDTRLSSAQVKHVEEQTKKITDDLEGSVNKEIAPIVKSALRKLAAPGMTLDKLGADEQLVMKKMYGDDSLRTQAYELSVQRLILNGKEDQARTLQTAGLLLKAAESASGDEAKILRSTAITMLNIYGMGGGVTKYKDLVDSVLGLEPSQTTLNPQKPPAVISTPKKPGAGPAPDVGGALKELNKAFGK